MNADRHGNRGMQPLDRRLRFALLALSLSLTVPPALFHPLASFDEAWYAAVARTLVGDGDWWNLKYNGATFWDKPPVAIWATATVFRVFGVSDFGARVFALGCGGATILMLFAWGERRQGVAFGLLLGLLLLATHDWLRFCAKGQMDVPVTLFVAGNVLCFWKGIERPWFHLLGGVCLGLGVATKNQVGAFGVIAMAVYMILAWDFRSLRQWSFWASFAVAGLVAAPWFVQQYLEHGRSFVDEYWRMNVTHRQYGKLAGAGADYLYYPRYLLQRQPVFATAVVAAGLWAAWQLARAYRTSIRWSSSALPTDASEVDPRWLLLLAAWSGVVFATCVKLGAVHFWYLMPMYPATALLLGEAIRNCRLWRRPRLVLATVAGLAILQQAGYYLPPPKENDLWAAKSMAAAIQNSTPATEPVYLADVPAGRPKFEIHIPCAHYYFDRIAIELLDRDELAYYLPDGAEATLVGAKETLRAWFPLARESSVARMPSSASAAVDPMEWSVTPIAAAHGYESVRIRKPNAKLATKSR